MHPKQILQRYQIEPKKSLGQNFLFDEQLLRKLVVAADVTATDSVLEIGPGIGALTREIAKVAQHVVAVELDQRLLPILGYELANFEHIKLVHGDILKQQMSDFFSDGYKVVANVPYYITGAILSHLLDQSPRPSCMVLTVQKEVAHRISAKPGKLNLMALGVQFYGTPSVVGTIAAGAFWPRPKVDSAIVKIDLHEPPAVSEKAFFRVAKTGFSQKRKQLKNNMRQLGLDAGTIEQAFVSAEIDATRRAETLTIAEWVRLTNALNI